jgi:hypothetical protein
MNIELPLRAQEKPNTCALACLRMILAAFGMEVSESELRAQANLEKRGTSIVELKRLAGQYHLEAGIEEVPVEDFWRLFEAEKFPIAFIDRAVFDLNPAQRIKHSLRDAKIHTVVPTLVTEKSIAFHDPVPPRIVRKSIRLFRQRMKHSAVDASFTREGKSLSRPWALLRFDRATTTHIIQWFRPFHNRR